MICSMTVRTGSLEESEDGGDVFESETILSCVVKGTESTDLKTDSDGKSGESGTLECVIPEHYYDTMRISVSTGYQSVVSGTPTQDSFFYYYKWVPVMVPVEADTESAADDSTSESTADSADDSVWIIQDESENALESAGEDSGTEIDETIIKGKDHKPKSDGQKRSEDTAAKTAGVVGGSGVAAAAAAAAAAAKKKNKDKKTAFKMMISKDFGDAICRGAEPVYVRARIVEVDEKGNIKSRPDLTGMITVRTDGLLLHGISSDGGYIRAAVSAGKDNTDSTANVIFGFKGKGGEPEILHLPEKGVELRLAKKLDADTRINTPESQKVAEKYRFKVDVLGRGNFCFIPVDWLFQPDKDTLYGAVLNVSCRYGGAVYERYIPFRLIGEVDEDMGNWDKEYSELKRRVEKFSLPAEKEKWL